MRGRIGTWAFIGGVLLAVLAGFGQLKEAWPVWILALLGLVVGGLNIGEEDMKKFLISAIALSLSATAVNIVPAVGVQITEILTFLVIFISAALLFIAGKMIWARLVDSTAYVKWLSGIGIALAVIAAIDPLPTVNFTLVLATVGLILGVLYVYRGEEDGYPENFILSAIALQLSGSAFQNVPAIGAFLTEFFRNIVAGIFAILLVVALAAVFRILDRQA